MIRALIALLLIGGCGVLQAAPLVYFALEGRPLGSSDPFSSNVEVELGDTVEYRLRAEFAPLFSSNVHLRTAPPTMVRPGNHGLGSLSISIIQTPAEPIQVDLSSLVEFTPDSSSTLRDGWGNGTGARTGISTLRLGSSWSNLLDIRPVHDAGVFTARDEEVVFSGLLTVASIFGPSGQVNAEWGPTSGGGWFHGYSFYPTGPNYRQSWGTLIQDTESSSDPLTHFTPLTLTAANFEAVPEPSTIALAGAALVGLAWWMRRGRLTRRRL